MCKSRNKHKVFFILSARMGSSADQIWLLVGSYYFSAYCPLRLDGQRCCPLWCLRAHSSHVIVASPPARIYFQRVIDTVPFKKLNGFKGPKVNNNVVEKYYNGNVILL
ncbi:hypothetical protein J6590_074337 [Homalodisca vitripennis]|nr:hypothetical protein J6590_074337 [Homalodisca vitripennis]